MLNPVTEGEEDYIEAIRYRRRLKICENFLFFFVLSVSCWNIRFGAICHFRPTNSASFRENLRPYSLISPPLNLRDHILFIFGRFRRFRIPLISQRRCVQRGS